MDFTPPNSTAFFNLWIFFKVKTKLHCLDNDNTRCIHELYISYELTLNCCYRYWLNSVLFIARDF